MVIVVQLIRVTGVSSTSELCRRGQVWGAARAGGAGEGGRRDVGGQKPEVLWAEVNPVCTAPGHDGFPSPSPALFLF